MGPKVYVIALLTAGCTAAQGASSDRVSVGAAVPVMIEATVDGAPCVTWVSPMQSGAVLGPPVAVVDPSCCPPGYAAVGLAAGATGEDAVVCLVSP